MFQRLGTRLSITFIALSVMPLIVVGFILGQFGFQQLEQEAISRLIQINLRATSEIESYINSRVVELQLLSEVDRINARSLNEQSAMLGTLLNLNDDYEEFYIVDSQGREVVWVSRLQGTQLNSYTSFEDNEAFLMTMEKKETYYGDISFEGSREPLMTIAQPIINLRNGEVNDILIARFRFSKIWNLIANINLGATETAYVVNDHGQVIAHSNPSIVLSNTIYNVPDFDGIAKGLSGSEVVITRHELQLGTQSLIVITEQPTAEALALATNGLYVTVIVTILALAVAVVLVIFSVRGIVRPIETLSRAAKAVSNGDLSVKINIKSQDELGELGDSFNKMTEDLRQSISDLEHQVIDAQDARQQAERSDQVKSSFLASMSHELRTPLNAIINFTKFVAQGDVGSVNEDQKSMLYEVVDSAKHLLNLINDVLDMSKIESGSLNLFIVDDVDLIKIINKTTSTAKGLLGGKPIVIKTEIIENLPLIRGDRQRITQILLNILSNACKFTEEGSIVIRAEHRENDVRISISDTGSGIAPEDYSAVFEAFNQTQSGLRQGGGSGLGMPITKNLIEAHGGQILLDSQLDKGTTFTVILPVVSEALVPTLA